jgi:hypothetical protein
MSSLLKPSRAVPLLGGAVAAGKSKAFSKQQSTDAGLHRFGQQTLLGVYRWLILSLTAYLLAYWAHLNSGRGALPDWGEAAQSALELLLPLMALLPILAEIQRLQPLAKHYGIDINVTWCKI